MQESQARDSSGHEQDTAEGEGLKLTHGRKRDTDDIDVWLWYLGFFAFSLMCRECSKDCVWGAWWLRR